MNQVRFEAAISYRGVPMPGGEASAFARIVETQHRTFSILANASRSGFERASPFLSSKVLDDCALALGQSGPSEDEQFEACFACAYRAFADASASNDSENAAGSLLVAAVSDNRVSVQWVGPDEAWLVRTMALVERSRGHIVSGPGVTKRGVTSRAIGPDYPDRRPERLQAPWILKPHDRLMLLSRSIIRSVAEADIVQKAASTGLHDAVDALVHVADPTSEEAYVIAIGLECRSP